MSTNPELISFDVCPFVQRSVITLLEKGVDFKITYIDLYDPPPWFAGISPLRKVPVLRVGDTALFESAVINEYLDEVNPPSMHPSNALERARNRAWIEFASDMIMNHYHMSAAADEADFVDYRERLADQFAQLEEILGEGPFFNGAGMALVDAAFAPLFMRIDLLAPDHALNLFAEDTRLGRWARALLSRESVRRSVPEDFKTRYTRFVASLDSHYAHLLSTRTVPVNADSLSV